MKETENKMENKKLNYQFTVFGDFSDISPNNSKTTINLLSLQEEKNFMPSIFQEILSDSTPAQVNNRIALENAEGWYISIGTSRLDISMSYKEKSNYKDMDINVVTEKAVELITKLFTEYEKSGNRLALNTAYILGDTESRILTNKYNEKEKILSFYNNHNSDEWNERIMSQVYCEKFNNETLNVGTNINKVKNAQIIIEDKSVECNGVILQMDINTTPENKSYRFNTKNIKKFFDVAIEYNNKIYSDVQELVKNE